MAKDPSKLDEVVRQARLNARQAAHKANREQALKLFPGVRPLRAQLRPQQSQLLEVHHKNSNHDDNPPDGTIGNCSATIATERAFQAEGLCGANRWRQCCHERSTFNPFARSHRSG